MMCKCTLNLKDGDKVVFRELGNRKAIDDWLYKMAENPCFLHGGYDAIGIVVINEIS